MKTRKEFWNKGSLSRRYFLVRIYLCSCHYCQFSSFLFFIFSWDYMYISFYFLVQIISASTSLSSVRQQRTISSLQKKSSGPTKVYKSVFFIFIFWFIKFLINHINWRQINWSSSIKCNRRRFFRWNGSSVFSLICWVIGIVTIALIARKWTLSPQIGRRSMVLQPLGTLFRIPHPRFLCTSIALLENSLWTFFHRLKQHSSNDSKENP